MPPVTGSALTCRRVPGGTGRMNLALFRKTGRSAIPSAEAISVKRTAPGTIGAPGK